MCVCVYMHYVFLSHHAMYMFGLTNVLFLKFLNSGMQTGNCIDRQILHVYTVT